MKKAKSVPMFLLFLEGVDLLVSESLLGSFFTLAEAQKAAEDNDEKHQYQPGVQSYVIYDIAKGSWLEGTSAHGPRIMSWDPVLN